MGTVTELSTRFHTLLHSEIGNFLDVSYQHVAVAVYFDNRDLAHLAAHFYSRAEEKRRNALRVIRYFVDRNMPVDLPAVCPTVSGFTDVQAPLALALECENRLTDDIAELTRTAHEEGDYLGEQFVQWFLQEQVAEVATMNSLATTARRAGDNLFRLETFVQRELAGAPEKVGAPLLPSGMAQISRCRAEGKSSNSVPDQAE
ncbi:ferritin [Rhodococcus artemisiae]|uniref:Ferritin n=1 Tax=Rhodococcus artemisiae TaxID=714159 RepID=A0ABU7L9A2_9NOCA|nr:ferritin-like domain-containing protein [Rhodococcus artemisiae]MEE2058126.1 ferritin-like domain-containing protein [Rhodococcus artemisiae]